MSAATSERCPACGGSISSIDTACRYCTADLLREKPTRSSPAKVLLARLDELSRAAGNNVVEQLNSKQTRARAIEDCPIPEDKVEALEMLAVAVGNVGSLMEAEERAWAKKARQLLARATIHGANDADYQRMAMTLRAQLGEAEARVRRLWRILLLVLLGFGLMIAAIALGKGLAS